MWRLPLELILPARMFRREDLPDPDGPRIAVTVPGEREPETRSRMTLSLPGEEGSGTLKETSFQLGVAGCGVRVVGWRD